jgi:glycine betaine/choline ABC-type transport system substrate-binding protein
MNRPDGYPGLVRAYGLNFEQVPREMDRNLLYQSLVQDSLDLAAGDSTDGRIAAFDLIQLRDDRRYFPPYEAVPLVREKTLERYPSLREVLNSLAGKIDAAAMRRMNQEVDQEGKNPEQVARDFLRGRGLLAATSKR